MDQGPGTAERLRPSFVIQDGSQISCLIVSLQGSYDLDLLWWHSFYPIKFPNQDFFKKISQLWAITMVNSSHNSPNPQANPSFEHISAPLNHLKWTSCRTWRVWFGAPRADSYSGGCWNYDLPALTKTCSLLTLLVQSWRLYVGNSMSELSHVSFQEGVPESLLEVRPPVWLYQRLWVKGKWYIRNHAFVIPMGLQRDNVAQ